jgi:hypothetical protein
VLIHGHTHAFQLALQGVFAFFGNSFFSSFSASLILVRALAVTTKFSQSSEGFCLLEVMISTWSPLRKLMRDRHQFVIHFGTNTFYPHFGVYGKSKVKRRGTTGSIFTSPFGV